MKIPRRTDEQLKEALSTSSSIREALGKLDLVSAGGNYQTLQSAIKRLSIDVSHMTGRAWNRGKVHGPKRDVDDYLNNSHKIQSHKLRLRLLAEKLLEAVCNSCKGIVWMGNPIPLELNHVDGDHLNNQLNNLELLCPNCHALTPTYRGRNKRLKNLARDCQ